MAPRVLCVVGPTASGKTKMAVALARRFGGEVVSVDSMQIYRGMTIGTAAPTAAEMEGVPHHMIAVADPAESWSVARFCQAAGGCNPLSVTDYQTDADTITIPAAALKQASAAFANWKKGLQ